MPLGSRPAIPMLIAVGFMLLIISSPIVSRAIISTTRAINPEKPWLGRQADLPQSHTFVSRPPAGAEPRRSYLPTPVTLYAAQQWGDLMRLGNTRAKNINALLTDVKDFSFPSLSRPKKARTLLTQSA
ncbi:hypothetical protein HDV62DRAFT_362660 [Trichoderma sp. SZMC 28011]